MSRPAARRRPAISEKRRQELIQAAYNAIAERGFEGLRTRDVAGEVGVNIATLHYYFPTKESLIRGVVDHSMSRFLTTLTPHGSPPDQLRNHLRAVRQLLLDEPELGAVMGELALRSARDEQLQPVLEDMFVSWHTTMRGLLRRAVREGGLRPELDSAGAASIVMSTLTAFMLPVMRGTQVGDQALGQLEQWLGVDSGVRSRNRKSSK